MHRKRRESEGCKLLEWSHWLSFVILYKPTFYPDKIRNPIFPPKTFACFIGNVRMFYRERSHLLLGTFASFVGHVHIFYRRRTHLLSGTFTSFIGDVRIFYRERSHVYLTATLISPIMLFFIRSTLRWSDFFSSFSSRGLIGSTISSQARGYLSRWLVIK